MTEKHKDDARTSGNTNRATDKTDRTETDPISRFGRRRFLWASGVVLAGSFAGCLGGANEESDDDDGPSSVDEWLADTGNHDSVEDVTGESAVTVEVGAEGNDGANAFAPAAISITPGTTVTWAWVDGYHNVVDTDGQFDSGEPEQNATFEHTFETAGTAYYYCKPHESMGMKGAVVVEDGATETGVDGQ